MTQSRIFWSPSLSNTTQLYETDVLIKPLVFFKDLSAFREIMIALKNYSLKIMEMR